MNAARAIHTSTLSDDAFLRTGGESGLRVDGAGACCDAACRGVRVAKRPAGAACAPGPVACAAADACHAAGVCAAATGRCSNPALADGTPCPHGSCHAGACVEAAHVSGGCGCDGGTSSLAALFVALALLARRRRREAR